MEKMPYAKEQDAGLQHQGSMGSLIEREYADLVDLAVHDLDAPLRKLNLLVEMLTERLSRDKEMESHAKRIENCIGDMRSLIDDLSVLGKINYQAIALTSCNLDTIVRQALQELPVNIKELKAVITTQPLPVIEGDARLFILLFKNILGNAVKFRQKDLAPGIDITSSALTADEINAMGLDANRLYYKIGIADRGIGFKEEDSDKVFLPFVRLHGKSQFPGNGIGLAICKKITDIHHGIIYAEGHENAGARFILILPESHL